MEDTKFAGEAIENPPHRRSKRSKIAEELLRLDKLLSRLIKREQRAKRRQEIAVKKLAKLEKLAQKR
jgi:hypothetical protein